MSQSPQAEAFGKWRPPATVLLDGESLRWAYGSGSREVEFSYPAEKGRPSLLDEFLAFPGSLDDWARFARQWGVPSLLTLATFEEAYAHHTGGPRASTARRRPVFSRRLDELGLLRQRLACALAVRSLSDHELLYVGGPSDLLYSWALHGVEDAEDPPDAIRYRPLVLDGLLRLWEDQAGLRRIEKVGGWRYEVSSVDAALMAEAMAGIVRGHRIATCDICERFFVQRRTRRGPVSRPWADYCPDEGAGKRQWHAQRIAQRDPARREAKRQQQAAWYRQHKEPNR